MYNKTDWKNHVLDRERTYTVTTNADGTKTLAPAGTVVQQGTGMSAQNFNNMEAGIEDAHIATAILLAQTLYKQRKDDERLDGLEADTTAETGTVTLTNSLKFPFNNSIHTVSLTKTRKTLNYDVDFVVTAHTGNVGEITVSDKQTNGFKIAHDGSATSVTLAYKVRGGQNS